MQDGNHRPAQPVKNEHVAELLSIIKANNISGLYDLTAIFNKVVEMENQLDKAVQELTAIRHDFFEAEKQRHPIKNTLEKSVITLQDRVLKLRDKLGALKQAVIDGCKNAVATFKERGIAALDNIARFFKVRPILEAIQTNAYEAAKSADRAVSKIEAAGARFHEAGRNLTNAGRALAGKEAVQEVKPNGKALHILTAPYRAALACFKKIDSHAAVAVKNLNRLEEKAMEWKPPIKKVMREYNKKIAREERDAPKRETARTSPER